MSDTANEGVGQDAIRAKHLGIGWWGLLVFLTLGIGLEVLHAMKVGWYVEVRHDTRRLMFRLAHTHGTLVSLVHLAFALAAPHMNWSGAALARTSKFLVGALILLPTGFFLGGFFAQGGDPGIGIALVPPGALLLWLGVWFCGRASRPAKGA